MSRLQRARAALTRKWWGSDGKTRLVQKWAWELAEFGCDDIGKVRAVAASLILDGYPASWPRPLRKKERRRP